MVCESHFACFEIRAALRGARISPHASCHGTAGSGYSPNYQFDYMARYSRLVSPSGRAGMALIKISDRDSRSWAPTSPCRLRSAEVVWSWR